jgi:hypothetical protein
MNKNTVDVAQVFLVFMALIGDVEKTAIALDLEPAYVAELAEKEQWNEKIARVSVMSKSGNEGDWERAQNRALNFVQCHRLRRIIDDQLLYLQELDRERVMLAGGLSTPKVSARVFADLAAAMQKIHEMTYSALGDTVKERTVKAENDKTPDPISKGGLHAAIIATMNKSTTELPPGAPTQSLVQSTDIVVQEVVRQAGTPEPT